MYIHIYYLTWTLLNTALGYISCDKLATVQKEPIYVPLTHPLRSTLQVSRYPFHPASLYRLPVVKPFCSKVHSDFFSDKSFELIDVLQQRLEVNKRVGYRYRLWDSSIWLQHSLCFHATTAAGLSHYIWTWQYYGFCR